MKKNCIRLFTAVFGLGVLGAAAYGQTSDALTVNIPYEFVVSGKTLPAGSYRVNRANVRDEQVLVISSIENRAAVLVRSSEVVDRKRFDQPRVTFQRAGDEHLLSKIETAEHVFTITVSSPAVLKTATNGRSDASAGASGKSGSN